LDSFCAGSQADAILKAFQLAVGAMAFALALTVVLGRWVTANEYWLGALVRSAALIALAVLALSRFGSIWYWILLPLALVPLVDEWGGLSVTAWLNQSRHLRLSRALTAAAEHPANPVLRMNVGGALLETGHTEAGLAALEQAVASAPEDSRELLNTMAAEARQEFVRHCPACRHPNPSWARACRRCLRAVTGGPLVRGLLWLSRPALLRLRRPPRPGLPPKGTSSLGGYTET
jgi:hypothetical protein